MEYRDFSLGEKCLVSFLLRAANKDEDYISKFFSKTRCAEMDDGGMGSIRLHSVGCQDDGGRKFGEEIGSCHFTDVDGVMVSAALYVDMSGRPFELDVWKVDYSSLKRMPIDSGELVKDFP